MGIVERTGERMKPEVHEKGAPVPDEPFGVTLRLRPAIELSPDQLLELSGLNRDLRLELTAKGELIVMPPTGWETSDRNAEVTMQLRAWAKRDGTGVASDSWEGSSCPTGRCALRTPRGSSVPDWKL